MPAYSDEQLVLEALNDSGPAFGQLVKQYQHRVLRTIASIISDEQAAKDIAQETFLAAWSDLSKLREREKFGRWLNQIAINLSKLWLRDQSKHQDSKVPLDEGVVVLIHEASYYHEKLRQEVWDAIDGLSADHREVVTLYYISGYSYKEIGAMLSVPASTVHGRLQQAKKQLRKEFLDMVAQLQLEIDSAVHKFLKEHAKQDGVSVEGLIIRLIERYKRDTDGAGMTVRKLEDCGWKWRRTDGPSPDGRYFSFLTWDGNLVMRDLTTGEEREVISNGNRRKAGPKQSCEGSTWSPDSKKIAYQWKSDDCNELRIIGLDGSKPRVLYRSEDPALDIRPWDWSQDGKFILGGRGGNDQINKYASRSIVLISVADGSVRTLRSLEEHERQVSSMCLAPDGRYVAYARAMGKNEPFDVFLLATDGSGEEVRLAGHTDSHDLGPVWAPDGKSLVFRHNRGPGNTSLWLTRVADGKQMGEAQLVMEFAGYVHPKGFTREGSLYYDVSSAPKGHIYVASLNMETGKVESQPTRIRCEGINWNPVWSPDGKSLAYMSERYGGGGLVIRSMETGKEREIHIETFVAAAIPHRWSPDGRSILCGNWINPILIDVQTGDFTVMEFHRGMQVWYPEWSRDGRTIFYNFCHPDKEPEFFRIGAHDLETGEERELYTGGKGESHLMVSPDGQELAFTFSDEGYKALMVIPTEGGEAREILSLRNEAGKPHEHVSPVAWTPDGRYLLFMKDKHSSDGSRIGLQELWRISAEDGESQKLMELESGLRMSSLHPDGQRIAYAEMGPEYHELWVMENLLTTFAAEK